MKYVHAFIMLGAFSILSAGWWVGKVDTAAYVPLAIAAVAGTLWSANKAKSDTNPKS